MSHFRYRCSDPNCTSGGTPEKPEPLVSRKYRSFDQCLDCLSWLCNACGDIHQHSVEKHMDEVKERTGLDIASQITSRGKPYAGKTLLCIQCYNRQTSELGNK